MQILVKQRPQSKEVEEGEVLDTLTIFGFQHVALPIELCPKSDNMTPPPSMFSEMITRQAYPYYCPGASPARNNLRRFLFPVKGQAIISRFPGEIATGTGRVNCLGPHYMDIYNSTNLSSKFDAPVC